MITFLSLIHIVSCIFLISIVLLQTGKGAEMGVSFGGAAQTLFGSAGPASFLNKLTTIAAGIFMICALSLSYISAHPIGKSVMEKPAKLEERLPLPGDLPGAEKESTENEMSKTFDTESLNKTKEIEEKQKTNKTGY